MQNFFNSFCSKCRSRSEAEVQYRFKGMRTDIAASMVMREIVFDFCGQRRKKRKVSMACMYRSLKRKSPPTLASVFFLPCLVSSHSERKGYRDSWIFEDAPGILFQHKGVWLALARFLQRAKPTFHEPIKVGGARNREKRPEVAARDYGLDVHVEEVLQHSRVLAQLGP